MVRGTRSRLLQGVPSGVQHYPLAEVRRRRAVEAALTATLRGWSYEEVLLPILDYEEVFQRGMGHEASGRMYRLLDPEGQVLGVRPDLTPLVAKLVATGLRDEPLPIRLYYAGEVVRPEAPRALGRGEFHQIGFEQIGGERAAADLEVAVVALEAMRAAGLEAVRMTLSHSAILPALIERADLDPQAAIRVRASVDRRDARGLAESLTGAGCPPALGRAFMALLRGIAGPLSREALGKQAGPAVQRALAELGRLWEALRRLGYAERVEIDLAEAGGFEYYTGVRFRVYAEGVGFPVGAGGRYDQLLGRFGASRPAVGFSFGLDRVLRGLESARRLPDSPAEAARAVRVGSAGAQSALREALRLRRRGLKVRLC